MHSGSFGTRKLGLRSCNWWISIHAGGRVLSRSWCGVDLHLILMQVRAKLFLEPGAICSSVPAVQFHAVLFVVSPLLPGHVGPPELRCSAEKATLQTVATRHNASSSFGSHGMRTTHLKLVSACARDTGRVKESSGRRPRGPGQQAGTATSKALREARKAVPATPLRSRRGAPWVSSAETKVRRPPGTLPAPPTGSQCIPARAPRVAVARGQAPRVLAQGPTQLAPQGGRATKLPELTQVCSRRA